MAAERQPSGATNEGAGVNDRANAAGTTKTTTTKTTTEYEIKETTAARQQVSCRKSNGGQNDGPEVAKVEELGRQASGYEKHDQTRAREPDKRQVEDSEWAQEESVRPVDLGPVGIEGNKFVTSVGTIAAQSSQSRIVVAILRDGLEFQLRVQEMQPGIFEVGTSLKECRKLLAEHQLLMANLDKHKQAPIEAWLAKYKKVSQMRPDMSAELRLVYMCLAENLQGCWRGLLLQLEQRLQLLDETAKFYSDAELLRQAIERADSHVQAFRREFLEGPGSVRFSQAANELRRFNRAVLDEHVRAKRQQRRLVGLIGKVATGNLADSRANILIADAQNLIDFINGYIEPLERRKIQLENVMSTTARGSSKTSTTTTKTTTIMNTLETENRAKESDAKKPPSIREIGSFNDLHLVESWLATKIDQLNSSLLLSLGASAQDTRSILNKHEQIALECSAIEEATLTFRGKSIHALRPAAHEDDSNGEPGQAAGRRTGQASLLEQQRQLAAKAREVITILDARIVLLRRTIDFYSRAKEATADINKMMHRLQADNSLQSVQFVSDELELKDVSSVVASGATIISELQQLQLAQQHGQRSKAVGLQLETAGIRAVIDQLNQDLAHLKTVLNQRRLVLLNEDASKMAQNFTGKCQQLKFWLDSNARSFLLANNRIGFEVREVRAFCDQHEELRLSIQQKTLEVEALLRLLSNMTESFDAKSKTADEIQRDTDELRQDWISVTNCLEQRLELARKFLAILVGVAEVKDDIEALEGGQADGARSRTPDERTHEDIEAHVNQSLVQLANQVRNFALDAQRSNTALVYAAALETKATVNDINKQQVVLHANGSMKLLEERLKATLNRIKMRGPRKWPEETPGGQVAKGEKGLEGKTEKKREARQTSGGATERAPRFARQLADAEVEPFSTVVLECELEPGQQAIQVDWLLNNKRIPHNVKHSVASEGNRHRLTIRQFSPVCCGTYSARATNPLGAAAVSSCRLRLLGIREDESPNPDRREPLEESRTEARLTKQGQPWAANNRWLQQANKERALERIIQGVESPMSHDEQPASEQTSLSSSAPTRTDNRQTGAAIACQFPVTRLSYDAGQTGAGTQRMSFIDSPVSSAHSRSVSRSSFEGTPQPPVFMQPLSEQAAAGGAPTGLVCVVVGNPPPNVEWLHEGRPIASAKCPRPTTNPRANICKLTIETVNDRTLGRYVCRATNRLGQSSTALTLGQRAV